MSSDQKPEIRSKKSALIPKPRWLEHFEKQIFLAIPVRPNLVSGIRLLVIAPLLVLGLKQIGTLSFDPGTEMGLFLIFCILDYLDGVVARHKGLETGFGRVLERVPDYLVLVAVSVLCFGILPFPPLFLKLLLDLSLIILCVRHGGRAAHHFRTGLNYATLLTLLIASQGWTPGIVTPNMILALLWVNIVFSLVSLLYVLGVLQKRFVADALSGANLLCGVFSMVFAHKGRLDISLLFLMLGAAFDGFDGAAARKFGGTRWGVYSDDVADGVNYGIAPGVALWLVLGQGADAWVMGIFYSVFTISRLIFFTLNKAYGDPNYFCGVPSTVGALVTICSLILFGHHPVILGLMVGIACIQMVSFDTHYRHLGRALASNRRIIYGMPVMIVFLLIGHFFWGEHAPVSVILGASLFYGFLPTAASFVRLVRNRKGVSKG